MNHQSLTLDIPHELIREIKHLGKVIGTNDPGLVITTAVMEMKMMLEECPEMLADVRRDIAELYSGLN